MEARGSRRGFLFARTAGTEIRGESPELVSQA